ncbi:hypothetical protein HNQ76_002254 [Thermosulfuriphilus ammonigenes]|nr:hypothetical protein [Thermosulfuriphilus ammonigenes]
MVLIRRGEEVVLRKRKTLFELAGSLPNLGLSLEEMREKALEEIAREREKDLR